MQKTMKKGTVTNRILFFQSSKVNLRKKYVSNHAVLVLILRPYNLYLRVKPQTLPIIKTNKTAN